MTQNLRLKLFSSILKQEQGWFDSKPTGELINRLSADTQIVGQALTTNISDGLRSTIMVSAGTAMMVNVHLYIFIANANSTYGFRFTHLLN